MLDAFRTTDEQGRDMLLRLAKSLRRDVSPTPDEKPTPNPRPKRRAAGCIVPMARVRGR